MGAAYFRCLRYRLAVEFTTQAHAVLIAKEGGGYIDKRTGIGDHPSGADEICSYLRRVAVAVAQQGSTIYPNRNSSASLIFYADL